MRIIAIIAWSVLTALLCLSPAAAENRVALVIGNGAYKKVSELANPINDAKAIARMLQSAGFDAVALHENLGIRELRQAIGDFADIARDADTAIVYYSGHGIEVNGINYLIPIDAVLDRDIDVPYETFSLENLVQVLEPARRLRLVMLDACRNNPFVRSMKRTIGSRAVGRGLAPVEPMSVNTLIGYAAKAGSVALDGDGANSPYAIALLNNLATPGLDLRIAFGRVRDEVLKTTKGKQEPFVYGSLGGANVTIVDAPAASSFGTTPPTQMPVFSIDHAAQAWLVTKDTTSIAVLEDFIRQFGSTSYGSMARARLEELRKSQVAVVAPPVPPRPLAPPPASSEEKTPDLSGGSRISSCAKSTGTWKGAMGGEIILRPGGSALSTISGNEGTWSCNNAQVIISWKANGAVDWCSLSPDGMQQTCRNSWGATFTRARK
jgi:Caspase domain